MKGIDPRNKNFIAQRKIIADSDNTRDMSNWQLINRNKKWLFGWIPGKKQLLKIGKTKISDDLFYEERILNPDKIYNLQLGGLTIGNETELYGWIYDKAAMKSFPVATKPVKYYHGQSIVIDRLVPGKYKVSFQNTMTGNIIGPSIIEVENRPYRLRIPDFRIDIAFKIRKI